MSAGLRERLGQGETYGGWCSIPNGLSAEVLGRIGFDWVCVDMQHGVIGRTDALAMLQALEATGTPGLVRVGRNDPAAITEVLDLGAAGIIVPLVNSVDDAAAAMRAVRYPPHGARSFGPTRAGLRPGGYAAGTADLEAVVAVQIETSEAVAAADDIAAMDGIDVLLVGPADLSLSMGLPVGSVRDDDFRAATRRVVEACLRHGKVPAMFCSDLAAIGPAREDGFAMFGLMTDVRLLRQAAADALATARSGASTGGGSGGRAESVGGY